MYEVAKLISDEQCEILRRKYNINIKKYEHDRIKI